MTNAPTFAERQSQPSGLAWPLKIADGDLAISVGDDLVYDAISQVVQVVPLERVYRPRYGVPDPVFTTVASEAEVAAAYAIAIETQVKAVKSVKVDAIVTDDGGVEIGIVPTVDRGALERISFAVSG